MIFCFPRAGWFPAEDLPTEHVCGSKRVTGQEDSFHSTTRRTKMYNFSRLCARTLQVDRRGVILLNNMTAVVNDTPTCSYRCVYHDRGLHVNICVFCRHVTPLFLLQNLFLSETVYVCRHVILLFLLLQAILLRNLSA